MTNAIEKTLQNAKDGVLTKSEQENIVSYYANLCTRENAIKKEKEAYKPIIYALLGTEDEKMIGSHKVFVKASERKGIDEKLLEKKYHDIYEEVKTIKAIVSLFVK